MCKFIHIRNQGAMINKGGKTIAYTQEGDVVTYAVAQCHERDNFCRHTGRVKAEGRLNSARYRQEIVLNGQTAYEALMEAI